MAKAKKKVICPDFNRVILVDFQGITIFSDSGFNPLLGLDDRFRIIDSGPDIFRHSLSLRSQASGCERFFYKA